MGWTPPPPPSRKPTEPSGTGGAWTPPPPPASATPLLEPTMPSQSSHNKAWTPPAPPAQSSSSKTAETSSPPTVGVSWTPPPPPPPSLGVQSPPVSASAEVSALTDPSRSRKAKLVCAGVAVVVVLSLAGYWTHKKPAPTDKADGTAAVPTASAGADVSSPGMERGQPEIRILSRDSLEYSQGGTTLLGSYTVESDGQAGTLRVVLTRNGGPQVEYFDMGPDGVITSRNTHRRVLLSETAYTKQGKKRAEDTRLPQLQSAVQSIRGQIALFTIQHDGKQPTLWADLTDATTFNGRSYGPYLPAIPGNPFNGKTSVGKDKTGDDGWAFTNGRFYGNANGTWYPVEEDIKEATAETARVAEPVLPAVVIPSPARNPAPAPVPVSPLAVAIPAVPENPVGGASAAVATSTKVEATPTEAPRPLPLVASTAVPPITEGNPVRPAVPVAPAETAPVAVQQQALPQVPPQMGVYLFNGRHWIRMSSSRLDAGRQQNDDFGKEMRQNPQGPWYSNSQGFTCPRVLPIGLGDTPSFAIRGGFPALPAADVISAHPKFDLTKVVADGPNHWSWKWYYFPKTKRVGLCDQAVKFVVEEPDANLSIIRPSEPLRPGSYAILTGVCPFVFEVKR